MRGKLVLAVVIFLFNLSAANAQREAKNEIGLMLGGTVTPNVGLASPGTGKLNIGSGTTFQFNYARRLMSAKSLRLHFEIPVLATPQQPISSAAGASPRNYASLYVTPSLRATLLPAAMISPWLSIGGGYARFDESSRRIDGTPNSHGNNGGAAQFGGGIDIRTPIKILLPIGVRLEVRDLYASKPNYNLDTGGSLQHNLVFSGGLVLSF